MVTLSETYKLSFAKSVTELAIQNNLFAPSDEPSELAKDVTTFFKTVYETVDNDAN